MRQRVILFLKGMCMGFADVIPGVSGGTLALILGIYKQFVDALRGVNLRWIAPGLRWVFQGRSDEDARAFMRAIDPMNLPFLVVLISGIFSAILVGSTFIPYLLENHPVPTKAFFFELILASVLVPVQMIRATGASQKVIGATVALGIVGAAFGWWVTAPSGSMYAGAREVITVTSQGETLKEITRRGPTSATAETIYWMEQNAALRTSIEQTSPAVAAQLSAAHEAARVAPVDKAALKSRAVPYQKLEVPEGVEVAMPQPALWFIFAAGAIAICAMILPGISGSYILLIFGVYFFILNALKGMLGLLATGVLPTGHILYLGVFGVAIITGILSFARALSFLLDRAPAPTLGALVGLMLGCLRGVWPFVAVGASGAMTNVWPSASTPGLIPAIITALIGFAAVVALTVVGNADEDVPQELAE